MYRDCPCTPASIRTYGVLQSIFFALSMFCALSSHLSLHPQPLADVDLFTSNNALRSSFTQDFIKGTKGLTEKSELPQSEFNVWKYVMLANVQGWCKERRSTKKFNMIERLSSFKGRDSPWGVGIESRPANSVILPKGGQKLIFWGAVKGCSDCPQSHHPLLRLVPDDVKIKNYFTLISVKY